MLGCRAAARRLAGPAYGGGQGGAPGRANASGPEALAVWWAQGGKAPWRGEARLGRAAEAWVGACREQDATERF
jgi:hypothetical protein